MCWCCKRLLTILRSETLENERDLMEKRCENKINNLKSSLKKYYSQELEVSSVKWSADTLEGRCKWEPKTS